MQAAEENFASPLPDVAVEPDAVHNLVKVIARIWAGRLRCCWAIGLLIVASGALADGQDMIAVNDIVVPSRPHQVRSEPGPGGSVVAVVRDQRGRVIGGPSGMSDDDWWQVRYKQSVSGWSPGSLLRIVKKGDSPYAALQSLIETEVEQNPICSDIGDFYWSMGSAQGVLVAGSAGAGSVVADSVMSIASAGKFLYAAYVAEKSDGVISNDALEKLRMLGGYTTNTFCLDFHTTASCFRRGGNDELDQSEIGKFFYGPGHMLALSYADPGLRRLNVDELGAELGSVLGMALSFNSPKLAGAGVSSASEYEKFLTAVVGGNLYISQLLGAYSVCTNPSVCPESSSNVPGTITEEEIWEYSLGHWVESDPERGDGSFSSPGAFGFYPWIDNSSSFWGVLSRYSNDTSAAQEVLSINCGRHLRGLFLDELP